MTNISNPVLVPILKILRESDEAISEYELMLQLEPYLESELVNGEAQHLDLFRKHFLVMNALYRLQLQSAEDGLRLSISPLAIQLTKWVQGGGKSMVDEPVDGSLRAYYLDWKNFSEATSEHIDDLLGSFWQRYLAGDKQLEAYKQLRVEPDSDWHAIQSSYRKLANKHHPDKGGELTKFIAVREAYEILIHLKMRD